MGQAADQSKASLASPVVTYLSHCLPRGLASPGSLILEQGLRFPNSPRTSCLLSFVFIVKGSVVSEGFLLTASAAFNVSFGQQPWLSSLPQSQDLVTTVLLRSGITC